MALLSIVAVCTSTYVRLEHSCPSLSLQKLLPYGSTLYAGSDEACTTESMSPAGAAFFLVRRGYRPTSPTIVLYSTHAVRYTMHDAAAMGSQLLGRAAGRPQQGQACYRRPSTEGQTHFDTATAARHHLR
jgi:hypothetical protein